MGRVAGVLAAGVASVLLAGAAGAGAQLPPINLGPTTTTTRPSTSPPTTASPGLGGILRSVAPTTTAPPRGVAPAVPAPGVPGNGDADGGPIPADAGPFPDHLRALMNSVRRTRPRNTAVLMDGVRTLEGMGVAHDEAVRAMMGRFPVGGYASYSHDWWFPRFGPGWRLHQGTDLFAPMGTPVRAPSGGHVRFTNGGLGGLSTYVIQNDGTYFYMTHLSGRPAGLRDGQAVNLGDVVGFVGNSGNARGGPPHLHFEIHPAPVRVVTTGKGKNRTTSVVTRAVRPGTVLPAVDPKAYLDQFIDDAAANVPAVVAAYQAWAEQAQAAAAAMAPAPPPAPSVPGLPADPAGGVGGFAVVAPAAHLTRGEPVARLPLAALAFVLLVIAASLNRAVRPRPVPVPMAAGGAEGPAPVVAPPDAAAGESDPGEDPGEGLGEARRRRRRLRRRAAEG